MKKKLLFAAGFLVLLVVAVVGFAFFRFSQLSAEKFDPPKFTIADEVKAADLELGKRIVNVRNACIECHGANLAGAKFIDDPAMGTLYGSNITPFRLKNWTDEQIATAVRYGVKPDGSTLRGMPSFEFENLSKTDLAAVVAYVRSVPEVQENPPAPVFGPVGKILGAFGQIPILFSARFANQKTSFGDKPAEGPTQEFGKYLANSCTGCHGHEFKGGKIPGGDPNWPPASDLRLGADSAWTEETFNKVIDTGVSPRTGQPLRPPMPVAILKGLNEMERKALWAFLSSLK